METIATGALAFVGSWEALVVVVVIVLLFFGSRVPQVMRSLGKGVTQFKKGMKEGSEDSGGEEAKKLPPPDGDDKTA